MGMGVTVLVRRSCSSRSSSAFSASRDTFNSWSAVAAFEARFVGGEDEFLPRVLLFRSRDTQAAARW